MIKGRHRIQTKIGKYYDERVYVCVWVLFLPLYPKELMIPVMAPKVSTDLFIHPLTIIVVVIVVVISLQKVPDCNNNYSQPPAEKTHHPHQDFIKIVVGERVKQISG